MTKQPEALELADRLDLWGDQGDLMESAACLRRQHAEIEALKAQRAPLTDEQIDQCYEVARKTFRHSQARIRGQQIMPSDDPEWHFARAVEAAHGIGEKK